MSDPRRPLAVTLSRQLLAEHRGGQLLALERGAIGQAFTLRAEAPRAELYRLRADGHGVEMPAEPLVQAAAPSGSAVAVMAIDGPLCQRETDGWCGLVQGYDGIASRLRAVLDDPRVGAVVLRVNSPGGDVAGLDEGARMMRADIDRAGKPVLVQVDETAASAAYYLAASLATGGIYLPEAARAGCIGTIAGLWSEHRALDAAGIDVELICDPPGKSAGWAEQPISDLARARTQELVSAASAEFYAVVSGARGISVAAVRAVNGDMLRGSAAVRAGLADGIAGLPETIAKAAELARARASATTPTQTTTDPRGRVKGQTMDHAYLAAKLGLAPDATEQAITDRLGALTAIEADVTRIGGDANARRSVGTIEALVATGRAARDIEAKAVAARVDSMLLGARQSKGLGLAEAESLKAKGATDPDWLEGHLASMPSRVPPKSEEPESKTPGRDAGEGGADALTHDGKSYADMSNNERAALNKADAPKFHRMRAAFSARKG